MLPQSTERIVEVSGGAEGVRLAIVEISKCLIEDWDRSQGTVLYHPDAEGGIFGNGFPSSQGQYGARRTSGGLGNSPSGSYPRRTSGSYTADDGRIGGPRDRQPSAEGTQSRRPSGAAAAEHAAMSADPNFREQKISIPSDMVGCIIGRGRHFLLSSIRKGGFFLTNRAWLFRRNENQRDPSTLWQQNQHRQDCSR